MFRALSIICAVGAAVVARGKLDLWPVWWFVLMVPATLTADVLSALLDRRRA